jgi:hypothetical protein
LVCVRDHRLDAAQAAPGEPAREGGPEGFRLRRADGEAENLAPAVGVDRNGDDRGDGHDPPAFADLEGGGLEPEMRPVAFERALEEPADALVDVLAQLRDLGTASRLRSF